MDREIDSPGLCGGNMASLWQISFINREFLLLALLDTFQSFCPPNSIKGVELFHKNDKNEEKAESDSTCPTRKRKTSKKKSA